MYPNLKLQLFRSAVRQNFLARELGMDESILSKIIHGYREPSPEQRQKLSGYLGVEEPRRRARRAIMLLLTE